MAKKEMQTTGIRRFGGKYYYLKDATRTKRDAKKYADRYRQGGMHLVRVAPITGGYGIFLKTIGTREPSAREVREMKRYR